VTTNNRPLLVCVRVFAVFRVKRGDHVNEENDDNR